ncbi:MAG: ABC transporter ATP-binding protein [Thermoleophilia bacterium]
MVRDDTATAGLGEGEGTPRHTTDAAPVAPSAITPALNRAEVVRLRRVTLRRGETTILSDVDWCVRRSEHWAVLGSNGSGKTTLLQVVAGYLHPSEGTAAVLGGEFGRVDLREMRRGIGWVSPALVERLHPRDTALDVVVSGAFASIGLFFETPGDPHREAALGLLEALGCGHLAARAFGVLSQGERQRVVLARALMSDPRLLVLDEPAAGLDIAAREDLLEALQVLVSLADGPTVLLVTHHLEEVVPGFTHALLLAGGRVSAAGPRSAVLTGPAVSGVMGVRLEVLERGGRSWAIVRRDGDEA